MKSSNKNSTNYNLSKLTTIEIYELVKSGKLKKFPNKFWQSDAGNENALELTRYLIEKILNWNDEDIKKKLRQSTFRDNNLGGLICCKYNDSAFAAITNAYPEKNFHAWDFVNAPNDYWKGENGKENAVNAIKWLIEEKLKWSEKEIIEKLNHDVFIKNNLHGMLKKAFNCTIFEAIEATYPGKFKKWQIGDHVKNNYWDKDKGIIAVKWLLEDKLKWSVTQIKENYCKQIYQDNNLYGMIQSCFNTSPFEAINSAYPNRFKEWELHYVPKNFWNSTENCIDAAQWLFEEKLNIDVTTSKQKPTCKNFTEHGLKGLCDKYSIIKLIEMVKRRKTINL